MSLRIVRLGTGRAAGEGLRLGTVRRPPRGVPKGEYGARDFYDVWLPLLAPSAALVKQALAVETPRQWARFEKLYRREMGATNPSTVLDTLAALSLRTNFSVGCYCAVEERCHRSILRRLFAERGAAFGA